MMKYEIFKDVVENAVLDYLPPEFQNSELHLQRVKKVQYPLTVCSPHTAVSD